jgi:di/tricarboxylate transporter
MTVRRCLGHYLGVSYFVHPVPLSAVALMVVNDHDLKYRFPSWWTGKLSDFAGLFFFPLFLVALYNLFRNLTTRQPEVFHWINSRQLLLSIVVADAILAGVKVSPTVRLVYLTFIEWVVGLPSQVTADPSDILALFVNPLTYVFGRRFFNQR